MATTARAVTSACAELKRQIKLVKDEIKAEEALRRAQAARLEALQHQTPPDIKQIGKIKARIVASTPTSSRIAGHSTSSKTSSACAAAAETPWWHRPGRPPVRESRRLDTDWPDRQGLAPVIARFPVTPLPSATVYSCPASSAPRTSRFPLGQTIVTSSAFAAVPSPNVSGSSDCER